MAGREGEGTKYIFCKGERYGWEKKMKKKFAVPLYWKWRSRLPHAMLSLWMNIFPS
jgi:hypothetical protein